MALMQDNFRQELLNSLDWGERRRAVYIQTLAFSFQPVSGSGNVNVACFSDCILIHLGFLDPDIRLSSAKKTV